MKRLLYLKLAAQNIRLNHRFYIPYLLTGAFTAAMNYIIVFLSTNEGLHNMRGGRDVQMYLSLGAVVIAIFSLIFLLYSNSFVMKRRRRELGLYNILGLGKRHIALLMLTECVYTAIISIAAGLATGILLSKLLLLFLYKLLSFAAPLGLEVSLSAVIWTVVIFAAIYALTLIINLFKVSVSNPITLLYSANRGEREPKTKLIMALLGVLSLGGGYYISITTESPIDAIALFFVAVLLVILGSYLLFTAGSIAVLKLMRKNQRFYYKTRHFTAVSGMLYRMKQNAVGLASICILATMVMIMVSSTVCLYAGIESSFDGRYEGDYVMTLSSEDEKQQLQLREHTLQYLQQGELSIRAERDYRFLNFGAQLIDGRYSTKITSSGAFDAVALCLITQDDYRALCGTQLTLGEDQVAFFASDGTQLQDFTLFDSKYTVKYRLTDAPSIGNYIGHVVTTHLVVVSDMAVMQRIERLEQAAYDEYGEYASDICYRLIVDTDGTPEQKTAVYDAMTTGDNSLFSRTQPALSVDCREQEHSSFYALFGGLLFLGIFLGVIFMMATVLIIYYKQISEGYEDCERLRIMQKVGMSRSEVKRSIGSQVRMVFFLPLLAAAAHITAAFPMIQRLLMLFQLTDAALFARCTLVSFAVFAVIYTAVYLLTSRAYFKIVR